MRWPTLILPNARHVPVQRGVAAAVVEDHRAAVAALPADELHARIARGHDRRAGAGGVVHALVHAHACRAPDAGARRSSKLRRAYGIGMRMKLFFSARPSRGEVFGLAVAHDSGSRCAPCRDW